jgi:hypothetical protein
MVVRMVCATLESLIYWSIQRGKVATGPIIGDGVSTEWTRSTCTEVSAGLLALFPM